MFSNRVRFKQIYSTNSLFHHIHKSVYNNNIEHFLHFNAQLIHNSNTRTEISHLYIICINLAYSMKHTYLYNIIDSIVLNNDYNYKMIVVS